MARPLRIDRVDGRYHASSRGNERKAIYRDDRDRTHFLELLSELRERFGVQVQAYVLMENHFHLLVETPEANLSRAMQWLNVSYSLWFNRRHDRVGHLFQGRFKAVLVENLGGWQQIARYVHLNPVRITIMGLGKQHRAAARLGFGEKPSPEIVAQRLRLLREWRWSSYRAYAGYSAAPEWLVQDPLRGSCGGRTDQERRARLREFTEQPVRLGTMEKPWDRLIAGIVLGSEKFAQSIRQQLRGNSREQAQVKQLSRAATWEETLQAVERAKGEPWKDFCQRHGDWGRDATLWLARRFGRLKLAELGERAGGMDYAAVGQALARFGRRLNREHRLRKTLARIQSQLSNV
jgi:putative transposase